MDGQTQGAGALRRGSRGRWQPPPLAMGARTRGEELGAARGEAQGGHQAKFLYWQARWAP